VLTIASPPPKIWILIPAYNASAQVGRVVREARQSGHPVLVVDDGSQDATAALAAESGALVLRHPGNRGKGAALQTGFAYAVRQGADAVLTLDADGQHDPQEIAALLAAFAATPAGLVLGVRSFDPSLMPRRSRIGNQISTFFISHFAGRRHRDTQTGFRVYPARLLRLPLRSRRFDTETELLLWASKLGLPLIEVPIQTIYRVADAAPVSPVAPGHKPPTHFRNWEDTLRVIKLVIGSPWWHVPTLRPNAVPAAPLQPGDAHSEVPPISTPTMEAH
jgi:glycosyltransferase involved in cell wall biosynthesis